MLYLSLLNFTTAILRTRKPYNMHLFVKIVDRNWKYESLYWLEYLQRIYQIARRIRQDWEPLSSSSWFILGPVFVFFLIFQLSCVTVFSQGSSGSVFWELLNLRRTSSGLLSSSPSSSSLVLFLLFPTVIIYFPKKISHAKHLLTKILFPWFLQWFAPTLLKQNIVLLV